MWQYSTEYCSWKNNYVILQPRTQVTCWYFAISRSTFGVNRLCLEWQQRVFGFLCATDFEHYCLWPAFSQFLWTCEPANTALKGQKWSCASAHDGFNKNPGSNEQLRGAHEAQHISLWQLSVNVFFQGVTTTTKRKLEILPQECRIFTENFHYFRRIFCCTSNNDDICLTCFPRKTDCSARLGQQTLFLQGFVIIKIPPHFFAAFLCSQHFDTREGGIVSVAQHVFNCNRFYCLRSSKRFEHRFELCFWWRVAEMVLPNVVQQGNYELTLTAVVLVSLDWPGPAAVFFHPALDSVE